MVLLLLFLNAFFVAGEFATVAAKRTSIEPLLLSKNFLIRKTANAALHLMRNATDTLATCQLGITACSLYILNVAEPHFHKAVKSLFFFLDGVSIGVLSFLLSIIVVTFLHVVLGEMLPKSAAVSYPRLLLLVLALPLFFLKNALYPIVYLLNAIANLVLRCLRIKPQKALQSAYGVDELLSIVSRSKRNGVLEDRANLLERSLYLESVPVLHFVERDKEEKCDMREEAGSNVYIGADVSAGWALRYMLREGVRRVQLRGCETKGVVSFERLEAALLFGTGIEGGNRRAEVIDEMDGKG